MTRPLRVTVSTAGAEIVLRRTPKLLERELHAAFRKTADAHIGRMRIKMRAGGGSVTTRTGRLYGSLQKEIRRDGRVGGLRMRMFSAGVPYADIQERGGIVRPRPPRKFLAIPTDDNLTASGVARIAMNPRDYDPGRKKTFVLRLKSSGRLYIVERMVDGSIKFLWRLVSQVRIRGRLGWFDTWRNSQILMGALIRQGVKRALDAAVRKGAT